MNACPVCSGVLEVERVRCAGCGIAVEGRLGRGRLSRLSADDQRLAEEILLAGGNLKDVAAAVGVSFPTLRKRLDRLIEALQGLRERDDEAARGLLDAVEAGSLPPEEAARRISEMNGG